MKLMIFDRGKSMLSNYRSAFRGFALSVTHLALMGAAGAETARLQSSAPPTPVATSESDSQQLEEIIITAQRRTEKLIDVPISVQVITGDQLSEKAISDTRDLATIAPTVNFSSGYSALSTAFSLRGVSSLALQTGIQPSTAMVVDGVALARQAEFISSLSDIDHIEVLNGPQGTLFGKNSTAGVISIATRAPTRQLEALIEGMATNDSEYRTKTMVNVPITDTVRLRINGFYDNQKPLIENLTGPDVLGAESYGANMKVAFDLGDKADFLISGTYSHTNSSAGQFSPVGANAFGYAFQKAAIGSATICRCVPTINTDESAIDLYKTTSASGRLNWSISDKLNLISVTSFSRFNEDDKISADLTPFSVIVGRSQPMPGAGGYPFQGVDPGLYNNNPDGFHYVSQETRLNYIADPVNVVVGAYYQSYFERYRLDLPFILDGSLVGATPGVPFFSLQYPKAELRDRTASLFADSTVAITKVLKTFGGVRFTNERVAVNYHRDDYFGPASLFDQRTGVFAAPPVQTVNTTSVRIINNVSGRGGVEFEPTENSNFYASYARGYKAPAASLGQNLLPGADPIIQPEIADSVEVGAKVRVLENRVAMNIALFNERIQGIQLGVIEPGVVYTQVLINAGTLRTRGVEADGTWALTPQFKLGGAFAYDDTAYSGFNYTCNTTQLASGTCPNYPSPGFQSINGQQAIESPKIKYSLSSDYANMWPGTHIGYYAHVDWTWNSAIYYELGQDPISREPSHGLLNASVGFKGEQDKWEIQLFAKNLTNKLFFTAMNNVGTIARPTGYLSRDFQRYGGVKVTFRF
jgi:iron complex outermembrane receptor protein